MAPRFAMRCMPSASVMVVIAGRPSGMAATAWLTASRSSSCHSRPPGTRGSGQCRGHCHWTFCAIPQPSSTAESARHARRIWLPKRSSRCSSGVFWSPTWRIISPMRPSSVRVPIAVTIARPLPRTTLVPVNTIVVRSASGASRATGAIASLAMAALSPVSDDSSVQRSIVCTRRASAGTESPASRSRMSPGTTAAAGTTTTLPPRRRRALGAVSFWSASSAASARRSW